MSSGIQATPSGHRGGRASLLGRRWAFVAAAVAALGASVIVVLLITGGGPSKSVSINNTFGKLPAWLPKSATPAATPAKPQLEQASPAHPILSEEQGYTVHATLATGSADITAVGPSFPSYVTNYATRGQWAASRKVPSTFLVTIANVKGNIPISSSAFSVEDQAYQTIGASLSVQGGGTVPTSVHAGQTLNLEVHSQTLEGQGAIAWSPLAGNKALIAWIYQVELD